MVKPFIDAATLSATQLEVEGGGWRVRRRRRTRQEADFDRASANISPGVGGEDGEPLAWLSPGQDGKGQPDKEWWQAGAKNNTIDCT